ncbi:MAG TPA: ATP-binding cassette domain-containing protein, partial [Anaerovoracaceae bacterium]|nr:ATP-binding cassette domain-containing protein [Anaerovoracaceae bacterium]
KQEMNTLEKVNLTIQKGEIVAVIGASGCGKSTLLKVIGGIIADYQGVIEIDGIPLNTKKNLIGYIPQGYGLLPWKTVMENCLLPLKIRNIGLKTKKNPMSIRRVADEKTKALIKGLLNELEIGNLSKRYPATLSGGQRQRVALVRALSFSPQILLMDEPFSALDAIMRDEAAEIFLKVWKQNRCSTVIVTHSIDEAVYIGKRIVVMGNSPGRIKKIIENPLYGDESYKERDNYKEVCHLIKEEIREVDQR